MSNSLLPPKYFNVPVRVLFDSRFTPAMRETLIQLMSLGWNQPRGQTPPVSLAVLSRLTGKPLRTLRGHIAALRNQYAVLQLQLPADGLIAFTFSEELYSNQPGEILPSLIEEEVPSSHSKPEKRSRKDPPPPPDLLIPRGKKPPRTAKCTVSAAFAAELQAEGVFPEQLQEILAGQYSEASLRALLRQVRAEKPVSVAAVFVYRVKTGAVPEPSSLCAECGWGGGKHAPDCGRRYLSGEFADWLDH